MVPKNSKKWFPKIHLPGPPASPGPPGAVFFWNFPKTPPPQGAKRPGGAAEGGAGGILENISKKSAPGEEDF